MTRRVVITGLGLVSPHGDQPEAAFTALCDGISAIVPWNESDMAPAVVAKAAFDVTQWFSRLQLSGVDRVSQIAVAAAESARRDAGWGEDFDSERAGIYVGSGMGGAGAVDDAFRAQTASGRIPPLTIPAGMVNAAAAHVAMRAKIHGPVLTYSVACASSAIAIAEAARAIACGDVDRALAGGTEALLVPGVIRAWQALQTLARPDDQRPETSCRPFSKDRSGLVLGEGAAFMVLEPLESALARGARIYAEFGGSGISCDATHLTKPDASGQIQALKAALKNSNLTPREIGYCNAHGTATLIGDVVECNALQSVWSDDLDRLRISSTKSMHGHLLGGAGALEAIVTILSLVHQIIPPTTNSNDPDPACNAPIVRGNAETKKMDAAISNSFAFGGTNAVLVFKRWV